MNKKMQYLIENSLKKKFKSKSFIFSNIAIILSIFLLCNIDTIIKFFGGDFDKDINIYLVDESNAVYEQYDNILNNDYFSLLETNNYVLKRADKSLEELEKQIIEDESEDIILNIKSSNNIFDAEIISYEYIDQTIYQTLLTSLNQVRYSLALDRTNISPNEIDFINQSVVAERIVLNDELTEEEEILKTISSVIIPIFILPFFMLILMIVSMIGAEINEEKSSKSMEIIISSVSPKVHFASKIISVNIFVIAQSLLLVLYAALAIFFRIQTTGVPEISTVITQSGVTDVVSLFLKSDLFKAIISAIPFILIIFLLSFVAFSLLAGILASMTTNIEDYQQLQTPLSIILIAAYYIAMFASLYESSVFIKIVSYIPFISAIVDPALLIMGQFSIIDMGISIVLLIVTIFLLIKYGSRIYKVGILNYNSSKLWKKMAKAMKEK